MIKLTIQEKINKYYKEHPFFEEYCGWKIRLNRSENKYLGTIWYFTCDVRPGAESCISTNVEMIRDWIDQKINEGKTQQEDI